MQFSKIMSALIKKRAGVLRSVCLCILLVILLSSMSFYRFVMIGSWNWLKMLPKVSVLCIKTGIPVHSGRLVLLVLMVIKQLQRAAAGCCCFKMKNLVRMRSILQLRQKFLIGGNLSMMQLVIIIVCLILMLH